MLNKKGFTLVEILVVIALIGLLFGIGIPGVMKISEKMKERSYKTKVELIEQAGILWGQDNKTRLQTDKCDLDGSNPTTNTNNYGRETKCHILSIESLIKEDYLDADKINEDNSVEYYDGDNNNIKDTCVWVYKKNNRVYAKYGKHCKGCATDDCKTANP